MPAYMFQIIEEVTPGFQSPVPEQFGALCERLRQEGIVCTAVMLYDDKPVRSVAIPGKPNSKRRFVF